MNLNRPKNSVELEASIAYHEWQQANAKAQLANIGKRTVRATHPIQIVHDWITDAIEDPDLQHSFYETLSQSSGALARKLIVRHSDNEWVQLAGDVAQKGISTWLAIELKKSSFRSSNNPSQGSS